MKTKRSTDDNSHLTYGWRFVPTEQRSVIEAGVKALARIDKRTTFHEWYEVGLACYALQNAARDQSGADSGGGYNKAFARCITDNPRLKPLAALDDATRSRAVWLAQNWETVAAWHAELPEHLRRHHQHPVTVQRYYKEFEAQQKRQAEYEADTETEPVDFEEEEEEEEDDLGGGREPSSDPEPYDITDHDSKIAAEEEETAAERRALFDALWERMPTAERRAIAEDILAWHEAQLDPTQFKKAHLDVAEIGRAVSSTAGKQVRKADMGKLPLTGFPQQELLAMSVEESLTKDLAPGEDYFPASDDIGAADLKRPGLKRPEF